MNLVYRITGSECLRDNEDTAVGRLMQSLIDILDHQLLILHETVHTLPDHTQALLDSLLESTSDRHHLANRLHAGTQLTSHAVKLTQVPARDLTYHVIKSRLKESASRFRHGVFQVEQTVAQA